MRRNTLFWGIVLILAGAVLLLDNLGFLAVNVWNLLWPLFLIALGIWILWGTVFRRAPDTERASLPLDGARRARVTLRHGAGRLSVDSGAGPENLFEGEFGGGLDLHPRRDGDLQDVTLGVPVQVFPFFWGPGYTLDWSLRLTPNIPISLDLETGANEARLNLTGLQVTDLRLKSGASSTVLLLPENAGATRARIESGAASVRVEVPSNVAARIQVRSGLSSIQVDSRRFPRLGEFYQSPDYETAANRVDLAIETGVGSVEVR